MIILYEDDEMPIGKYEGYLIKEIVNIDPYYINKFNHNNYAISDEVIESVKNLKEDSTYNYFT